MDRAYSVFEIKAVDDDARIIEGVATTPKTDRIGDIVEPEGAQFKLPLPLLWQHDRHSPIGHVLEADVTEKRIRVRAQIASDEEPGPLKDLLDKAWRAIKKGLVRGLSIGFRATEPPTPIDGTFGLRFTKWEWLELSAVTIPANVDATITAVKQYADGEPKAASGRVVRLITPGASGTSTVTKTQPTGGREMTIAERIAAFEATRAAKIARMEEITDAAGKEGRTKDEAEREEFDTLKADVAEIDRELNDLREMEKLAQKKAKPVDGTTTKAAGESRSTEVRVVRHKVQAEPGIRFARLVKCIGMARGWNPHAAQIAESRYGDDDALVNVIRAAVAAGTTSGETWAGPLVGEESSIFADFVEFLRPQTILGRFGTNGIPSLRRVPFRTRLVGQTSGGAGYWVGEGKPKPLTKFDFSATTLEPLKVANIAVLSEENIRDSSPSSDTIVRDQLAAALRERMDRDFIDPDVALQQGVRPASITNGVVPIPSSGTDADAVREDVRRAMQGFIAANNPPTTGVWIMSATTALALSLMRNALGQREFPDITMFGGMFEGLPVLTSEYVPTDDYGAIVVLANASDIYFADEGDVAVDMSREASLEMLDSSFTQNQPTGASLVSLWQNNLVGFRAERTLNWARRRDSAVQVISEVNWGAPSES